MKPSNPSSRPNVGLAAIVAASLMFGAAQNAAAAGTTAGTSITNSATLSYTVSAVAQTPITSTSTAFLVDAKINLTVAGGVTTSVYPNTTAQATAFSVTNNANSPLDFGLSVVSAIAGDDFNPSACNVYVEDGTTPGSYQPTEDTATFIDELAADDSKTVYAVCNIPGTALDAETALVGLVATARGNFTGTDGVYVPAVGLGGAITQTAGADTVGTVDIVFADVQGSETASDADRDAKHSARNTYLVTAAALTVSKTATLLCDPFNGVTDPKNIPGAITRWTITISNAVGAQPATLSTVTDTLSATLLHDAHLSVPVDAASCVSASATAENAANDGFKVTVSASRVLGGSAAGAGTTSYFTTNTADGLNISGQAITATFSTILPIDAGTGHATAGLLNAGESVTINFNTTVQ